MSDSSLRQGYGPAQVELLARAERDLRARMSVAKPRRLAHSLSVARTAEELALLYGEDPFEARLAGLLHDWDKVLDGEEQLAEAMRQGIDLGVEPRLVLPLLHGLTAAGRLPRLYPELPESVIRAIRLHTLGSARMTGLDMILFVADGIEPLRKASPGIARVREMLARGASLPELYWESFASGVSFVIETRRYLYPGTIETYNQIVLERARDAARGQR